MYRPIYLASKSPRRQELLRQLQVPFEVLLPDDAEAAEALEATRGGERPSQYVERVTRAKMTLALATRAARELPDRAVLTSDTTVALGSRILGKPADAREAVEMLKTLSGQTHRVITGVAVGQGNWLRIALSASRVRFARLSARDIADYLASGEGFDKAGGYAIQGLAARFVRDIQGSYSGIMGLPLFETARLLSAHARRRTPDQ